MPSELTAQTAVPVAHFESPALPNQPDTILSAILLAATGGILDTVVYVNHGHVFANAMTGNVILLGVATLSQNWLQVVRLLVPLFAFACGVAASRLARASRSQHAAIFSLGLEISTLLVAGTLPASFSGMAFSALMSFVSAFQVATFRQVGRFSYASTFITGNMRDAIDGYLGRLLNLGLPDDRRRDFAKARKLTIVCGSFLAGVLLGAWAAPRFGNRSFWVAVPLLVVVAGRTIARSQKELHSE